MLRSFSPPLIAMIVLLLLGFAVMARSTGATPETHADRLGKWGPFLMAALLAARASGSHLGELAETVEWSVSLLFFGWAMMWLWVRRRERSS